MTIRGQWRMVRQSKKSKKIKNVLVWHVDGSTATGCSVMVVGSDIMEWEQSWHFLTDLVGGRVRSTSWQKQILIAQSGTLDSIQNLNFHGIIDYPIVTVEHKWASVNTEYYMLDLLNNLIKHNSCRTPDQVFISNMEQSKLMRVLPPFLAVLHPANLCMQLHQPKH